MKQKKKKSGSFLSFRNAKLRAKLILPYLFLTFILALFGIYLVSTLINESMDERYHSQLLSAAETAGESFKYKESDMLSDLRSMVYTKGVSEALIKKDVARLYQILLPIKINSRLNAVRVMDPKGREILGLRDKNIQPINPAAFSKIPEVKKVLNGLVDNDGDKFAFIFKESRGTNLLYVVAPVKSNGRPVGAIAIGTDILAILKSLKSQSLANVTFYDLKGNVTESTIFNHNEKEVKPSLKKNSSFINNVLSDTKRTLREAIEIGDKKYDFVYAPLRIRGKTIGLYSVALRDTYFIAARTQTSKSMIIFFASGMVMVSLLGYALANYITNPIMHLVSVAKNIGKGNLTQRAQVVGNDEISVLANTINFMSTSIEAHTNQLENKIQELTMLYETSRTLKNSLNLQSIYESIEQIFCHSLKASTLLLLEADKHNDSLNVTVVMSADRPDIARLSGASIKNMAEFQIQEAVEVDRDIKLKSLSNGKTVDINSPLIVPLRIKGKSKGVIILSEFKEEIAGWANTSLLTAIGSEIAVAIENAYLYQEVSQRLSELSSLHKVGEAISSTLQLEEVIETVVSHTKKVAGAENLSLILIEPHTKKLIIRAAQGPQVAEIADHELKRTESITRRVLKKAEPVLISYNNGKSSTTIKKEYLPSVKDLISIPLITKGKTIGVINLSNKVGPESFTPEDLRVLTTLASEIALSIKNAYLYQDVRNLFLGSVKSLSSAIDQKDPYTHGHSERVTVYSLAVAEELGLDQKEKDDLVISALLHDIGKIGIPESILSKPGKLTDEEMKIIKEHPLKGVRIMEPIMEMKDVIPGMLHHHERFDGNGYPAGLKGTDIPLQGRIIAVADSFDAMISDRPYRDGMPLSRALKEIIDNSGIQFDDQIVEAFFNAYSKGKIKTGELKLADKKSA